MPQKGPKCKLCGKGIQIMSYDTGYLKVVKPGQPKAAFVCWKCAEGLLGDKLGEISSG
ncbi:MAG: hypothetical protein ACK4GQ_01605 [Candidatus Hadarchaeales archaeon]